MPRDCSQPNVLQHLLFSKSRHWHHRVREGAEQLPSAVWWTVVDKEMMKPVGDFL